MRVQPNTRSRRDVSRPRQAPLGRFPSTLSAENRRPTGYQQLLTHHGVGDRRCEIRLTQDSPIQAVTLNRYRRLAMDYEYRVQSSETMIDLAAIRLMLNHVAPA